MDKILHIICLDAPETPDYGGAIDMYHKIVALAENDIKIILHYFNYNKKRSIETLKAYCSKVYTYKRSGFVKSVLNGLPYIVSSRINDDLISCLNKDNYPILIEGIHCTGIISYLKNKNRKILVRLHNDEAKYYGQLADNEKSFIKRRYFKRESKLLHEYQNKLPKNLLYVSLSKGDEKTFNEQYALKNIHFLPCFISWQKIIPLIGKGAYCLYHGNMSVSENEAAAEWLIENIFSSINYPFVIAGKGISKSLIKKAKRYQAITLINNPTIKEIDEIVTGAHIHLLPSRNNTGVKLKLLHALFKGRFCITNDAGVAGSGLESLVHITNSAEEAKAEVQCLLQLSFTEADVQERRLLYDLYNNAQNAKKLIAWLY